MADEPIMSSRPPCAHVILLASDDPHLSTRPCSTAPILRQPLAALIPVRLHRASPSTAARPPFLWRSAFVPHAADGDSSVLHTAGNKDSTTPQQRRSSSLSRCVLPLRHLCRVPAPDATDAMVCMCGQGTTTATCADPQY
ncbi:uncharacterized protein [Triticum aestivum]|uniref:uncharacterized protein n=1 Tax=Triticum aestivum TaxID=4565 RepID=UPI001D020152|nr:uncharacterized protein LOC123108290 [Triticum aestivum]